jgi:GTP-binding protein
MCPKLALVGRPNVGKSSLFNAICKKRIAIVDEEEGVTRDRLYTTADFFGKEFELIDTGGIDFNDKLPFIEEIRLQVEIALEEADSIILVVDGKSGLTLLDKQIARLLFKVDKPITLAINKIDVPSQQIESEFISLGIKNVVTTSALHTYHIAELLENAFEKINWENEIDEESSVPKVAIIGRTNVGKSTLLNTFLDEKRVIVSSIAGTTRDNIDVLFQKEEKSYHFIDTAGVRRKRAEHHTVEKFAAIRTKNAIERSDVCLLILDVEQGMTSQDLKILWQIKKAKKAAIILFNKWDLFKDFKMKDCIKSFRKDFPSFSFYPIYFISAKTKFNTDKIFSEIDSVYNHYNKRIGTGLVNSFIEKAMQNNHPPMIQGKRLRIYYAIQAQSSPPRFVLFVNHPFLITPTYKRYLHNQLHLFFNFSGTPVDFDVRAKSANTKKR